MPILACVNFSLMSAPRGGPRPDRQTGRRFRRTSSAQPSAWLLDGANLMLGRYVYPMTDRIRLIKHEAVAGCGSFEVRFAVGRASQYFYFDDISGPLRPEQLSRAEALEQAKALAVKGSRRVDHFTNYSDTVAAAGGPSSALEVRATIAKAVWACRSCA
jgi:hypothetical protein